MRSRCVADRVEDRQGLVRVAERDDAGGLRERGQVVREPDALQVAPRRRGS